MLLQSERKELGKVDAFREHYSALKRHIDNTGSYLRKEVNVVEAKIAESRALMMKCVGCSIDDMDALEDFLEAQDQEEKVKHLLKQEIEEEDEEEVASNRPPRYQE